MPLLDAPDRYTRMYSRADVQLRENVWVEGKLQPRDDWMYNVYLYNLFDERELPDGFDICDLTALYYGMIGCLDDNVGRLLGSLDRLGLADNTIIVFLSDHGENLGSHHLWGKGTPNQESIRIPLIFHAPGQIQPRAVTGQVAQQIDVMPTLLGLVGANVPEAAQGHDLTPVLRGERDALDEDYAFAEMGDWLTIRTPRFRYTVRTRILYSPAEDSRAALHDLEADPLEQTNLAGSADHAGIRQRLHEIMREHHATTPWLRVGLDGAPRKETA